MQNPKRVLLELRSELKRVADPRKAPAMQQYMKSEIPYHGVPAPILRRIFRTFLAELEFEQVDSWESLVLHIWRNARFREEMYAAIALCESRKADAFQTPESTSCLSGNDCHGCMVGCR